MVINSVNGLTLAHTALKAPFWVPTAELLRAKEDLLSERVQSSHLALGTQKGTNLGLKCIRMRLAAGLRLSAPPDWGVPTSKGGGNEREKGRGKGGKGKDDLHTTLFLGIGGSTYSFCSNNFHNIYYKLYLFSLSILV